MSKPSYRKTARQSVAAGMLAAGVTVLCPSNTNAVTITYTDNVPSVASGRWSGVADPLNPAAGLYVLNTGNSYQRYDASSYLITGFPHGETTGVAWGLGHVYTAGVINPAVDGAVTSVDFSLTTRKGSFDGVATAFFLIQDAKFYRTNFFTQTPGVSTPEELVVGSGLTAATFGEFVGRAYDYDSPADGRANFSSNPNFSAAGGTIQFGYLSHFESGYSSGFAGGIAYQMTKNWSVAWNIGPVAVGWAINGSGDWNQNSNWTSGVPNGVDALANFGSAINTPQTVYTNTPVTVGTVRFDNPGSYQLAGQGSLGIDVSSGSGLIDVRAGNHKINLPLSVLDNTDIDTAAGSSLRISDPTTLAPGVVVNKNGPGVLTFESTLNASGPATLKINGGVANLDAANNDADLTVDVDPATLNVGADQRLGGLVLTAGGNVVRVGRTSSGAMSPAKLTVNSLTVTGGGPADVLDQSLAGNTVQVDGALSVQGGSRLRKQGAGVLRTRSLDIAAGAQLDLTGGRVIVDYSGASPLAAVAAKVASGYADGSWTGDGIVSSTAPADAGTGVGFAEASTLGVSSFGGEGVDGSSVLLRYTLRGDGNLDGSVNLSDFTALAAAFGGGSTWSGGDYNYDGVTNLSDFTALAANFGRTLPADPARAVPEPAAALAACVAGMTALRQRRK